jgi:hypothetical protein
MMHLRASFGVALGIGALLFTGGAQAQDNLELGKSAAQLFASDCAICHKSPQGLAKGGGLFGVQNFLRQHYTTSKESAAAIASYLEAADRAAVQRGAPPKQAAKPGKPSAKKRAAKPAEGEAKPSEPKAEAKPSQPKSNEPAKDEKSE